MMLGGSFTQLLIFNIKNLIDSMKAHTNNDDDPLLSPTHHIQIDTIDLMKMDFDCNFGIEWVLPENRSAPNKRF